MGSPEAAPPAKRSKAGRPPRINRQMIAEAAHERGLDGLTLRDVADHLGVSIAALYHHVTSKDDLMRLAAEYSAARVPAAGRPRASTGPSGSTSGPSTTGRPSWPSPACWPSTSTGAIPADVFAGSVEGCSALLVRQGFSIVEANEAYELVTSCALGTAVSVIREQELPPRADHRRRPPATCWPPGPTSCVHLRARAARPRLGRAGRRSTCGSRTVLRGIAVRRGEDPAAIDALVESLRSAAVRSGRGATP